VTLSVYEFAQWDSPSMLEHKLSVFLSQCRSYAAKILIINQISNVQNGFNTKAYYFTFLLQLVSTLLLKVGFTTFLLYFFTKSRISFFTAS
jgi:hypothetical protein